MNISLYKEKKIKGKRSLLRVVAFVLVMTLGGIFAPTLYAEEIFAELARMKSVESTFVSSRMAHNMKLWQSSNGSHGMDLSEGFSSLYKYECYSAESVNKARSILDVYLKKNPSMELVMRTSDAAEEYEIYEKFSSDNKLLQMIIFNRFGSNICEIVVVDWNNGLKR